MPFRKWSVASWRRSAVAPPLHAAIRLRRQGKACKIYVRPTYIQGSAMQVSRWGNSLAVRLPAVVVEALGLKEGDAIDIHVTGDRSFAIEKAPTSQELLARLRKYRGRLPAGFTFDRLEAHERHERE